MKAMKQMVRDAFNDHINSREHLITYPNDFIEWSLSNIYSDIIKNELKEFNHERSFKLLSEKEADYVLEMLQTRQKDFNKVEMLKPFYLKSFLTYKSLGENIGLTNLQMESHIEEFKNIDINTTIKILKKLKRLFYNRAVIVAILYDIKLRELYSKLLVEKIKDILSSNDLQIIERSTIDMLNQNIGLLFETDYKISAGIRNLYTEGLIFSGSNTNRGKMIFKFSNRDYAPHIVNESNSLNNLIQMLQIIAMTQAG